nr:ankyrin repeat-containing protein [Cedratvirus duvanny]
MSFVNLPVEVITRICSFLGGDAYVASMVPYLRPCIPDPDKKEFVVEVYKREDFAFIRTRNLLPTYDNVERCVATLVEKENLTILSWLVSKKPCLLDMVARKAAGLGLEKVFDWCLGQGCKVSQGMVLDTLKSGNVVLFNKLYSLGYSHPDIEYFAAFHGHLEVLSMKRIIDVGNTCIAAGRGGQLHVLQWLNEKGLLEKSFVLVGALLGLQREVVLWLEERKIEMRYALCHVVSCKGREEERLSFLQWLEDKTSIDYSMMAERAASQGHMKIVYWCAGKSKLDPIFLSSVFRRGTLEDIEFFTMLYHPRYTVNYYIHAAWSGDVDVLRWLDKKGCALPNNVPKYVVYKDMPEDDKVIACLEYYLTQSVQRKEFTLMENLLREATLYKRPKVFDWLLKHVSPSEEMMYSCLKISIKVFCVEIFSRLCEMGYGQGKDLISMIEEINFNNPLLKEEMLRIAS